MKPSAFGNWPARLPREFGPYAAVVDHVYDGDTVRLWVDVGLLTYVFVSVRLLGVNCPELREPGGPEAKAFLEEMLPKDTPVLLRTEKNNWQRSFERWLASIRTADGRDVASEIVAAGHGVWR